MNLQEEWTNLNKEILVRSDIELANVNQTIKKESDNLLAQLKKNVETKMLWGRGIGITALLLAVFTEAPVKYWLLGIFIVYEIADLIGIKEKKQLKYTPDFSGITKEVIAEQLRVISRILKIEEIWGYLFIPLAGPAGLMLHYLYNGEAFNKIINKPNIGFLLFALLLLGIPGIYLARRMNYYAVGKYIKKLKENLKQFEE